MTFIDIKNKRKSIIQFRHLFRVYENAYNLGLESPKPSFFNVHQYCLLQAIEYEDHVALKALKYM